MVPTKTNIFLDIDNEACHACLYDIGNVIQDGLMVFDETGSLLFLNDRAKTIFGYENADPLGFDISTFVPAFANDQLEEFIASSNNKIRKETLRYGHEVFARQNDGTDFQTDITITRMEGKKGAVFFCHFSSDISNRNNREQQLRDVCNQQTLVNSLLKISLFDVSLDEQLEMVLNTILDTPWLCKEKSGCVFLFDPDSDQLRMKASRGLAPGNTEACALVPLGECLCGQAAKIGKTTFGAASNEPRRNLQPDEKYQNCCCIPIYTPDEMLGVITLYLTSEIQMDKKKEEYFKIIGGTLAGVIKRKRAEEQTLRVLQENRMLTTRLMQTQEDERKKLARELHDELGQSITAIKTDAVLIDTYNNRKNENITESTESILKVAEHIYDVSHSIIRRMRPHTLDDFGLVDALRNHIEEWQLKRTGTTCKLKSRGEVDDFDEEINIVIFRIIQECLTNVIRHAAATQVEILLSRCQKKNGDSDHVLLVVTDNGRGLAKKWSLHSDAKFGLAGIRERVEGLDGSLVLKSEKGIGLRLTAKIPLLR